LKKGIKIIGPRKHAPAKSSVAVVITFFHLSNISNLIIW
jgi:hypothetical protein